MVASGWAELPVRGCHPLRRVVEFGFGTDRDLNVDDVFGGQAGYRGGTDVVDPLGQLAQVSGDRVCSLLVLRGPALVRSNDDDPSHAPIIPAVRQVRQTCPGTCCWQAAQRPCT